MYCVKVIVVCDVLVMCSISVMKKSFSQLNELIVLGGLMVYFMVLVYGFDGQFFRFNDSSLSCCYVSSCANLHALNLSTHSIGELHFVSAIKARYLLLCFGCTLIFGSILVKALTKLMKRSVAAKMV